MNNPTISIIVPIYNANKYLHRCIDSILAQTFKDLQLILVDDGSTDLSGKICDEYSYDERVTVVHKANAGVAEARNTGLDMVQGYYVGFVDADDFIEPDMYEVMYNEITKHKADVCCCGYFQENDDKVIIKQSAEAIIYEGTADIFKAALRQDYETGIGCGNWNKLFKKESIAGIRYASYANGEDVDFQFRVFENISRLICIPDVKYHYACNFQSASKSDFNEKHLGILDVADEILAYVTENQAVNLPFAYAFHLTWYMAVLQMIYSSGGLHCNIKKNKRYIERIRQLVLKNRHHYVNNQYAKRLDKYFMYALICHVVPLAIIFRKLVIRIRKVVQ